MDNVRINWMEYDSVSDVGGRGRNLYGETENGVGFNAGSMSANYGAGNVRGGFSPSDELMQETQGFLQLQGVPFVGCNLAARSELPASDCFLQGMQGMQMQGMQMQGMQMQGMQMQGMQMQGMQMQGMQMQGMQMQGMQMQGMQMQGMQMQGMQMQGMQMQGMQMQGMQGGQRTQEFGRSFNFDQGGQGRQGTQEFGRRYNFGHGGQGGQGMQGGQRTQEFGSRYNFGHGGQGGQRMQGGQGAQEFGRSCNFDLGDGGEHEIEISITADVDASFTPSESTDGVCASVTFSSSICFNRV
ncbi:hypothetical protein [Candidatus Ichthyocystis hellenicum]|uniref:hypothetical protein n=1 Tax=Candidatus Ichthyocystis hellenicum TaxID=1561003 RepID=UPI001F5F8A5C|nr:hypothetical protein [Candidatus Ichthyocystis hellenicum]